MAVPGPVGFGLPVRWRRLLQRTCTFDRDTVNGAPAARFVRRFAQLVERGELLDRD